MQSIITRAGSQLRHSTQTHKVWGRTKPTLSDDYVVGLTDGEGCFYVNVADSDRYIAGARVELSFHIKLQEKDRAVLEKIKDTIGCGAVYFQKERRRNHSQCYRYTVGSHRDITQKLIPFFLCHPLQSYSKQKNFEFFCQIADIVQRKEHLTEVGISKIRSLKAKMNQRTVGLA